MTRPFLVLVLLLLLSTASAAVMGVLLLWSDVFAQGRADDEPVLVGIVLDDPRSMRAAMIRCAWPGAPRHDHLVLEGESVCGRARLVEVLPDAVRLGEATGEWRIELRDVGPPSVVGGGTVALRAPRPEPARAEPVVSTDGVRTTITVTADLLRAYTADLSVLATEAAVAPRASAGAPSQIDGFVVTGVRPGGLLARLGIRDDDVVVSLNASALRSAIPLLTALGSLHQTRRALVGVERRGQLLEFEVRVE